ncbi:hypothetical protein BC833DRAFT_625038 [Globomyces pollinis-pini]|nr:hypothetical protein BC833DRAFT_625038 [Globomyces pollinis-pini]
MFHTYACFGTAPMERVIRLTHPSQPSMPKITQNMLRAPKKYSKELNVLTGKKSTQSLPPAAENNDVQEYNLEQVVQFEFDEHDFEFLEEKNEVQIQEQQKLIEKPKEKKKKGKGKRTMEIAQVEQDRTTRSKRTKKSPPIEEVEDEYTVEKILSVLAKNHHLFFEIKWEGYIKTTYESYRDVENCKELVDEFFEEQYIYIAVDLCNSILSHHRKYVNAKYLKFIKDSKTTRRSFSQEQFTDLPEEVDELDEDDL